MVAISVAQSREEDRHVFQLIDDLLVVHYAFEDVNWYQLPDRCLRLLGLNQQDALLVVNLAIHHLSVVAH